MKKVFFSFAIATMMASLMACGGKTEQNQDALDSTAVEAEAEEVQEFKLKEIMKTPSTMDNNKYFTVTYGVGEGIGNIVEWDLDSGVYGHIFPLKEDGTRDTTGDATLRVNVKDATLDDVKADPKKWTLEEVMEDRGTTTINGVDYWTFEGDARMVFYVAPTLSDNKVVIASIPQFAIDRNLEYIMNSLQTLKLK